MAANLPVTFHVTSAAVPSGVRFVPVPPCRLADTRVGSGFTGAFGSPSLAAGTFRALPIPASACNIPTNAQAYSLNVTVVPAGPLSFLTLWPTGQTQPFVSTLNAFDGAVSSNAAIVPAGTNGAVSVFVTDLTDVILDINGYFTSAPTAQALAMYPVTPCRVADTRLPTGALGGPTISAGGTRDLPVQLSACGIPSTAQAYSVNFTVVPAGPLGFLAAFPAGQARPLVSTLNSFDGQIKANAAILPAGTSGPSAFSFPTGPT